MLLSAQGRYLHSVGYSRSSPPVGTPWRASKGPEQHIREVASPSVQDRPPTDRKSTRLNSSHRCISYAVFCLKKNIETVRTPLLWYRCSCCGFRSSHYTPH